MKLQEYFDKQKKTYISEVDKFQLYENIITNKTNKDFSRKKSFLHVKSFMYSSFVIIFIIGLYGSLFINTDINNDGFIVKHSPITKDVQANYIAKVVDFNGNFYIENNGTRLQTSNIRNNDTIVLEEGTELIFHIDGQTQTKISGPAKFTVTKTDEDSYKISLEYYGDIVELLSLQDEYTQQIEIETPELTVRPTESTKPIKFQIIKEEGKQMIRNEGSQLTIINTKNIEKVETQVNTKQLASIEENNITTLSIEEFDAAIKENVISQTFKIITSKDNNEINKTLITNNTEETTEFLGINIASILETDSNINTLVIDQLTGILPQEQILSLEQNDSLKSNLNQTFLTNDIKNMFIARSQGDTNLFNATYANLEKKILALYITFDLTYTKSNGNPSVINSNISSLEKQITATYGIPPRYLSNLHNIQKGLNIIFSQELSRLTEENSAITKWNEIINSGEIQFK